jgi:alpha-tubulin suppressor-like RCC1 family protein
MRLLAASFCGLLLIATGSIGAATRDAPHIDPVAKTLGAGFAHMCVIVEQNTVRCAGENDFGQLGDGTVEPNPWDPTPDPVDVTKPGSRPVAVAAGGAHTCGLSGSGEARCWGLNGYGQLGIGNRVDRATPTHVLDGAKALAAGSSHTCAVMQSGSVMCWGHNSYGELGNGQAGCDPNNLVDHCYSTTPVAASGLGGVKQLALGFGFSCALTTAGAVFCWGGVYGTRPVPVSELGSGVKAISAGLGHICALMTSSALKCWGDNEFGQLGNGKHGLGQYSATPVTVTNKGVAAIVAGGDHTCVIATKGGVACWGRNQFGEIGDGTTRTRDRPTPVAGLGSGSGATEIAAGYQYTCARLEGDDIRCWGKNQNGQLGDGTSKTRHEPVRTLFGGPTVRFLLYEKGHQALKGNGPKFEFTSMIGHGRLTIHEIPQGNAEVPVVAGSGTIHVHRWLIYAHGVVDEENLTLEVEAPSGEYRQTRDYKALFELDVVVRKSDAAESDHCPNGSKGTIRLIDSPELDDAIDIDVCHVKGVLHTITKKALRVKTAVAIGLDQN